MEISSASTEGEDAGFSADLLARTRTAALIASNYADSVDAGARFPAEAFEALKAQRLLSVMVPRALGGEGASVARVVDVTYQLGQSCAATAMIYAMHQIQTACLIRHMQGSAALEAILRQLCARQLLLASATTEGQAGGDIRSNEASLHMADGRVHLERRANVISYGADADGIVATARRAAESGASDQALVIFMKSDYQLKRIQGWSALGMRGTCSEGYMLIATAMPEQIFLEPFEIIHTQTMLPYAHLLWGAVWTGIATEATNRAQAFTLQVSRRPPGQLPPGARSFMKAMGALQTLRGVLEAALRAYQRSMDDPVALSSLDFQLKITLAKVEMSELAVAVVLSALRCCGLSGYRTEGEFSIARNLRDVLSSPVMINNERIRSNLMNSALKASIPERLDETAE